MKRPLQNQLNDLSNTEWMISTKSIWMDNEVDTKNIAEIAARFQKWLKEQEDEQQLLQKLGQEIPSILISTPPQRDDLKIQHPATFAESDIERLILFFTKYGQTVLDPFLGAGSTCIAALSVARHSIGIEVVDKWADIAEERIKRHKYAYQLSFFDKGETTKQAPPGATVLRGDSRQVLQTIPEESVDFIVTSPPYWSILGKRADHKIKRERLAKGLPTKYSEQEEDLGNIIDYPEFIKSIGDVMERCHRVLKPRRYACMIVSDFRHKSRFYTHHADLSREIERRGYALEGITILVQNSKNLYPYGIPYAFVSNIHHQYILVFRRPASN